MRILYLTQFFDPEPLPKGLSFAKGLAAAGHEVRVLTGFPNYPGGKIYDGYQQKFVQHETIDGIRITRVPLYPSHDRSKLRRVASYGSFAITAGLAGTFSSWKPDVIYAYHPPLTVGLAAALIGFLRRVPFVYDIQDLWPDTLAATGMLDHPRALTLIGALAKFVYRRAAHLVVLSPGFKARLVSRGVLTEKITIIRNWCDEALMAQRAAQPWVRPPAAEGKFLLTFAGNMGAAQGLDAVLDAMALLQEKNASVHALFIGGGIDAGRLAQRAQSLTNVTFAPGVPMREMGAVYETSDALLVHLRDDPLFAITIPSKTQACLFAGKPILMAVRGDAAALVQEAGAGMVVAPEQPAALAEAILAMAALSPAERTFMGQRGRAFYDRELSQKAGISATLAVLVQAVKTRLP